ncbi:SulP family inorganic anion transporter [Sutterella megalosphaeroides]|uniref:Sodium-independent anion transporter n=1 Tax=Sutterella megalosphaeroides TaxID=2494234 RepID=A0A2Z6I6Y3_9BURK|nr:SulP family inorganic anion transporter [Sutterella megalosphaeroides]BBF22129.1 sodium-independent anion transporter [Sutterella megalosphaeroides]
MSFKEQLKSTLHHVPLAKFSPVFLQSMRSYNRHQLTRDVSAGLTVGMVALPLAMAFGIASGVPPEAGLYTAIIAGFLISLFGGCRVQIGGPAGAFVVIIYGIIAQYGLSNLMLATLGSGIILFFMGLFKLGGFIKFIPVSIVIGFTNGIAVMIGMQQVKDFLGLTVEKMPADFFGMVSTVLANLHTINPWALGIAAASFLLIKFWPKGYQMSGPQWKKWLAHLPGTVVVLVLSTALVSLFNVPVETIGSKFGGIPQKLPDFTLPDFDWATAKQLYGPMLTIAVLGSIESLLCARVSDTMTDDRHDPNQELMGQGIANMVVPFFGGIPATGTIARTVTNIKSGAASPVAGMVHAVTLLVVILVAAPLASNIPLSALAAILVFVAWNMGNWREFLRLRQMTLSYKATLVITFLLTVIFDLTVAVEVGLVVACIFFLMRMNNITVVEPATLPFNIPETVEAWHVKGALFFGSVSKLEPVTDPARIHGAGAARIVILDFEDLLNIDNSAMDQIEAFVRALHRHNHELIIAGASGHPLRQLERTGIARELGANLVPDMEFAVARCRVVLEELDRKEAAKRGE